MFEKVNELIFWKVFKYEDDKILMLDKTPFVMFPARAMAKFVQTITEDIGVEKISKIGYDAGSMVAEDFIRDFDWQHNKLPGIMIMIRKMFKVMGFGDFEIKIWNANENKILIHLTHHPVLEWGERLYGDKHLISPLYRAIYSAHGHKELGLPNCWLIETQSMAKGAQFYEWSYNVFKKEENS